MASFTNLGLYKIADFIDLPDSLLVDILNLLWDPRDKFWLSMTCQQVRLCYTNDQICTDELKMIRGIVQQFPKQQATQWLYGFEITLNTLWSSFSRNEWNYESWVGGKFLIAEWLVKKPSLFRYYRARNCFIGTDEIFRGQFESYLECGKLKKLESLLKMGVNLSTQNTQGDRFAEYVHSYAGYPSNKLYLNICDLLEQYGSWEGPETSVEYLAYLRGAYGSSGDESGDESESDDPNLYDGKGYYASLYRDDGWW